MSWTRWSGILTRTLVPLAVAVGAAAFFYYQRGWVLRLAIWTGLALGLLMYVLFERLRILRHLYGRR